MNITNTSISIKYAVILLAVLTVLVTGGGGALYYSYSTNMVREHEIAHTTAIPETLASRVDDFIQRNTQAVKLLAGEDSMLEAIDRTVMNVPAVMLSERETNETLDHFCSELKAAICYIMNDQGLTVASSNRDTPKSLIGHNYAFRPYFQTAIKGQPGLYAALGVTTHKRGLYFSSAVYNRARTIAGVVVIKFSTEYVDDIFSEAPGVAFLMSPEGVIFASNQADWQLHTLSNLTPEQLQKLQQSPQFGKTKPPTLGWEHVDNEHLSNPQGQKFFFHETGIKTFPGWKVGYAANVDVLNAQVRRDTRTIVYILLIFFFLVILIVGFIYRKSSQSIHQLTIYRQALEQSEDRLRRFSEVANEAIIFHRNAVALDANTTAEQLFGYSRSELNGIKVSQVIAPEYLQQVQSNIADQYEEPYESVIVTKSGERIPVEILGKTTTWDGQPARVSSFVDIRQRKKQEEKILYQATFDALTGLPNRTLCRDRIEQAIRAAKRGNYLLALMFIDLDDFKTVNDTLGHDAGDVLLQQAARRMQGCVRAEDTVARQGGDEFLVLLGKIDQAADVKTVEEKLLQAFSIPFTIDGTDLNVTLSIGVVVYPDDGANYETLLQYADIAMYQAKEEGKNQSRMFSREMSVKTNRQQDLSNGLQQAMPNGEFSLVYQPLYDVATLRAQGAEALLRWNNKALGPIPPEEFIPLLERTGMIVDIGIWVLQQACQQAVTWQQQGLEKLRMAVNVSPRQLGDRRFPEMLQKVLESSGLAAELLDIEVTEGLFLKHSIDDATTVLHSLRTIGVGLSMDDFGTGFSSLGYVRDYPFTSIKIDRSLLPKDTDDHRAQALVKAAVDMARALDMAVIAEGVETAYQLEFVKACFCDSLQGFLLSKPVNAKNFSAIWEQQLS